MNRSIKLIAALFCAFSLSLASAHTTIGIFDVNRALFETEAWKSQLGVIEQQFSEELVTVENLRAELAELFENIQINSSTVTDIELQRSREEGQLKQMRIQQIGERAQRVMAEAQNNFLVQHRSLISKALDEIYETESFDFIFKADSIVAAGFTYDVTPKVTARLNQLITSAGQ